MLNELATIFDAIPTISSPVQWDTNFEFAMLDGVMPTWFSDPGPASSSASCGSGRQRAGRRPARLPLLPRRTSATTRSARYNAQPLVEIANALSLEPQPVARLDPLARAGATASTSASSDRSDSSRCGPRPSSTSASSTSRTASPGREGAHRGGARFVHDFGVATDCGWGRPPVAGRLDARRAAPRGHDAGGMGVTGLRRSHGLRVRSRARRGLDARARRRLRHRLRQRRSPRLVPQPRSDRRRARCTC